MSATVHQLPARTPALVTKKQLAERLRRSPRWIEQQVAKGMPVEEATDRYGRRRYDVAAVEAWLAAGTPRQPSVEERLASLERQVQQLGRRLSA